MGLFDFLKQMDMNIKERAQEVNETLGISQMQQNAEEQAPPMSSIGGDMSKNFQSYAPDTVNNDQGNDDLYDPRMEKLIRAALADGVLTEKEKQILFKKAEAMGIDLDEFEMVLDARLYEKQHNTSQAYPQMAAPTSDKYGDVKKCPSCGAIVQSFTTRCPECGYEFRNVSAISSFAMLSAKLELLDKQRTGKESLFSDIDLIINNKKRSLIRNFPVPTTKEDILEFLSMATPLAMMASKKYKWYQTPDWDLLETSKAWLDKCKQIIIKARLSMKDDKKTLDEVENFAAQLNLE